MRGHIRERSAGHWAIVLDVHDRQGDADANGIPSAAPSERLRSNAPVRSPKSRAGLTLIPDDKGGLSPKRAGDRSKECPQSHGRS